MTDSNTLTPPPTCTVALESLREYMQAILRAAGCDTANAIGAADVFLASDLRGVGLQGLDHMPTLIDALRDGRVDGSATPRVTKESAAALLVDGGHGPGQVAVLFAIERAIEKARETGTCTAAITNSFDLFMLGHYTEHIALAGMVGLGFSDAPPMVRPFAGSQARLGTNPLSIAVPTADDPLILDLATSALSASRVRQAMYHGHAVPEAAGVDSQGRPTTDAAAVRAGAIGPLAGHKGFGLGLCVALLAGPLTGSQSGSALRRTLEPGQAVPRKGHLFIVIDPSTFTDPELFRYAASQYLQEVKSSELLDEDEAIRIPGQRAAATQRRTLETGRVVIYESVWTRMADVATGLGVTVPEVKPDPA